MSNNMSMFGDPNGLLEIISINGEMWVETLGLGTVMGYANNSINTVLRRCTPAKNTMLYTRANGCKSKIVNEAGIRDLMSHSRVCGPTRKAVVMDAIERFHRDKRDIQAAITIASNHKQDAQTGALVREIARMLNIDINIGESDTPDSNVAA